MVKKIGILALIGGGRLGVGPICDMLIRTGRKVIILGRKSSQWRKYLISKSITVKNGRTGDSKKLEVVDSLSAAMASSSMVTVCLCDNMSQTISQMKDLNMVVVSVGPNLEEVVSSIPKVDCPIMLLENDYDTALNLMKKHPENQILPCVIDCHSSKLEFAKTEVWMDYDETLTLQVFDPQGKVATILPESPNIVCCNQLWELEIYHDRKFYGINLPHRLLADLSLAEAVKMGVTNPQVISDYMTADVMTSYKQHVASCIQASFFMNPDRIKEFYNQDDYESAYDVYTSTLGILAMMIARKTEETGDTFSRVIKTGTDNYSKRLNQTMEMIRMLIIDLSAHEHHADSLIGSDQRIEIERDLNELLKLLEDLK